MVVRMALPPWANCLRVATKCMAVVLSRPAFTTSDWANSHRINHCITHMSDARCKTAAELYQLWLD